MIWIDREGRAETIMRTPAQYLSPRLSPDGTKLAVGVGPGPGNRLEAFVHGYLGDEAPNQASSIIEHLNAYRARLQELEVESAMTMIQGANHAFDNAALDAVELMAQSIDLFLDRLFVNPTPYAGFGMGGGRGRGPGRGGQ